MQTMDVRFVCRIKAKSTQMHKSTLMPEHGVECYGNCSVATQYCSINQGLNVAQNVERVIEFGAPAGIRTRVFGSKGRNT